MCVFCNQDQWIASGVVPEGRVAPPPAAGQRLEAPRKREPFWTNRVLIIIAVAVVLAAIFAVGALIRGLGGEEEAAEETTTTTATAAPPQTAQRGIEDFTLVPVTEAPTVPVTSAPTPQQVDTLPGEFQREDATALSAEQYARVLEQAKPRPQTPATVDPRSVVYKPPPPPAPRPERQPEQDRAPAETAAAARNRVPPQPISQPLPEVRGLRRDVTVRYELTVGTDGSVREVRILQSLPELTPKMVGAMQRWRFRPATENGQPVEGTFTVDISFNAD